MIFIFGEKLRSQSTPSDRHYCAVCLSEQLFTEHRESVWFSLFGLPLLPIEDRASYLRCEKCLSAYDKADTSVPSHVPLIQTLIVYLLMGYQQDHQKRIAAEISLKIAGFDLAEDDFDGIRRSIGSGSLDMVEHVRQKSGAVNAIGKQQILEAAFLTTYVCCDMQYEDRLRINLIGNALDVGLEFVDYAIQQTRKQGYYGVRRLRTAESEV